MATVFDTAQYIIEKLGAITTMKLQKLVYYSQSWHVVWEDDRLFDNTIEAWQNGPVVRELWECTRGQFKIDEISGANAAKLTSAEKSTVDNVLEFYGDKDAQWLSDLTHMEAPWKEAYDEGQNTEISLERISEYYSTLPPETEHAS